VSETGPATPQATPQATREAFVSAISLLEGLGPEDVSTVFGDDILNRLLKAIAKLSAGEGASPYDFLLHNKSGLTVMARLRQIITNACAVPGAIDGVQVYLSPSPYQWFDDGVMFLQGTEPFTGHYALYQNGTLKFALAARDMAPGEEVTPSSLMFVSVEELRRRLAEVQPLTLQVQRAPLELEALLGKRIEDESAYQRFLGQYPWCFGAMYSSISSHLHLDDKTIPDFTGVRLQDGTRDIFEIKSPFLDLFRKDGGFAADFNDSWNQAERYLDFTRRNGDYLQREKGLRFENPRCYLLIGHGLTVDQIKAIRGKERMNPAITVYTYDDVLTLIRNTCARIEQLRAETTGG
jgi:hypothetical protein